MTFVQILKLLGLSAPLETLSLYGSVALALLTCFFGYRLRQLWYSLLVFGFAGLLGYAVGTYFFPAQAGICLLIGLGAGLVVSLFTFRLYRAVVFLLAFACVFSAVGELLGELYPTLSMIAALVLGILAGVLASKFQYFAVIAITAASGGWRAAWLLRQCLPALSLRSALILAGVLIGGGLLFQLATTKKYRNK